MNVAMLIPTGLNCYIGGHSGDATPAAKLLAAVSDILFVHPNVVNAGDIIDMPSNMWYVPGPMLDDLIENRACLTSPKYNRIVLVFNEPMHPTTENAINAAKHIFGITVRPVGLPSGQHLEMGGYVKDGKATGNILGVENVVRALSGLQYDAVAVHTEIKVDRIYASTYQEKGGVNPWGGVEAMLTKELIEWLHKPVAHSPIPPDEDLVFDVFYPRLAGEGVSGSYLMSVLKGLSHCPQYGGVFRRVDFIVVPSGLKRTFPLPTIVIRENICAEHFIDKGIVVNNYLEAAGYIAAVRVGMNPCCCRADA